MTGKKHEPDLLLFSSKQRSVQFNFCSKKIWTNEEWWLELEKLKIDDSGVLMVMAYLNMLEPPIGLSVNDMIVKLGTVADLVSIHPGYQDEFPKEVPGPPEFRALAGELHLLDQESANKDRLKMALKAEKHFESATALTLFGQFAVMKAIKYKDMSYIERIGLDRKLKQTGKKALHHGPIGAPDPFAAKHGPDSGSLLFKVGKQKGAAHYDIWSCLGDPNNQDSWSLAATFLNTRNMRIDGLEPGKVYFFRVRCLGATGFGPWSSIIKIMVI